MTGLFDRIPKIKVVKRELESVTVENPPLRAEAIESQSGGVLKGHLPLHQDTNVARVAESVSVLPLPRDALDNPSDSVAANTEAVFMDDDDEITFAGEKSPTDAILEMSGDDDAFAVKGVTPFPPAFMAAQVQADYHDEIFGENNNVSVMLRNLCRWASRYNSSKKGERAKLTFSALGAEKQAEFQLEKEAKGMLPK